MLSRVLRQFALLTGMLVITACGASDNLSSSTSIDKALAPRAMMVVMGGFNSCHTGNDGNPSPWGMPMFQAAEQAASQAYQANPALTVSWFASCHTTDDVTWFITSEHPTVRAANLADVPAWIDELKAHTETNSIHVLGHSYGGWLGMKTALGLAASDNLDSLYTVDPISRVDCSFSQPQGCLSAPADISHAEKQRISQRTNTWKNFYETQTPYLHSSGMPEADANLEIETTHTRMDTDATVWRFFTNDLARTIARSGLHRTN